MVLKPVFLTVFLTDRCTAITKPGTVAVGLFHTIFHKKSTIFAAVILQVEENV